jgi:hypothetical protein
MSNEKYVIECNEHQLRLLSWACEKVSRIQMCQFDSVADIVSPQIEGADYKILHEFRDTLNNLKRFFGLSTNSYFGIYSDKVDNSARTAFDIYQVIRNYLAYEANPGVTPQNRWKNHKFTVDFDEPTKCDEENELIKVRRI